MVKSWPKLNRRVDTDDFEMLDGEQVYHPHEGEWLNVVVILSSAVMAASASASLAVSMSSVSKACTACSMAVFTAASMLSSA